MEYTLKDKITVTKDFIDELTEKSWHDIEHIQSQLANLADTEESKKVGKLLSSLLTSYYVFVGGLENIDNVSVAPVQPVEPLAEPIQIIDEPNIAEEPELFNEPLKLEEPLENELEVSEPFEYFVDFDDPTGEPLTDDDLYSSVK